MMLKLIPLTALALGLSSGVALADRHVEHRTVVEHRAAPHNTVVIREHGGGNYHNGAIVVHDRGWHNDGRVVVNNGGYGYRRPIYVSRPVIRGRYYNPAYRPALIVENYGARPGFYWVSGGWTWDGGEWIWAPGHYQPAAGYYNDGY